MTSPSLRTVFALVIACFTAPAVGQNSTTKPPNVVVVGASVSAGFSDPTSKREDGLSNRTYTLDVALKKAWPRGVARIKNYANMAMFARPLAAGRRQIDLAKKRKPDLLIAVDFPFWFGYGFSARGEKGELEKARLELQKKGLAMLEEFQCAIVAGDYPDMRGASTKMLPRYMIPNEATIKALNENLRAWASKRKNVQVFPLANFVKEAVDKEKTYPYGKDKVVFPKNYLLQSDRLHPTRLGALVLVLHLTEALPAILPKDSPLLRTEVTLKGLVEKAGIEGDLPEK